MSSRVGVEKNEYVCVDGHLTRQRADKSAPKRCGIRGCDERLKRVGEDLVITDVSSSTTYRKKVTKVAKTKQKEKTK